MKLAYFSFLFDAAASYNPMRHALKIDTSDFGAIRYTNEELPSQTHYRPTNDDYTQNECHW